MSKEIPRATPGDSGAQPEEVGTVGLTTRIIHLHAVN